MYMYMYVNVHTSMDIHVRVIYYAYYCICLYPAWLPAETVSAQLAVWPPQDAESCQLEHSSPDQHSLLISIVHSPTGQGKYNYCQDTNVHIVRCRITLTHYEVFKKLACNCVKVYRGLVYMY